MSRSGVFGGGTRRAFCAQSVSVAAFASAFFALALGTPKTFAAIAGRPDGVMAGLVNDCLADAAKNQTSPEACIERPMRSCLQSAATEREKKTCSDRELLVWIEALNQDLEALAKLLPSSGLQKSLSDVQRDFYIEKLNKCAFVRNSHNNSSAALLAASLCDVTETARQDLWLRSQIESFGKR